MNRCSTKRHSFKGIRGAWSRWSTDHGLFWICVTTRVVGHFSMRALSSLLRAQASCRTACAVRRKGYQPHRGNAYERCLARWRRQSSRANPRWKEKHSWPNPEGWHVSGMRQAVWWQSRKVQCAPTGAQGRVPAGPAVGCFARRLLGLACGDGVPVAHGILWSCCLRAAEVLLDKFSDGRCAFLKCLGLVSGDFFLNVPMPNGKNQSCGDCRV